jgi:hypothetical protein
MQTPYRNMPFAPEIARKMRRMLFFAVLVIVSSGHALAWKDGELLIWISDNRGYRVWRLGGGANPG